MHAMVRSSTRVGSTIKPLELVYVTLNPFMGVVTLSRFKRMGCGDLAVIKIICSESPGVGVGLKLSPYVISTSIPLYCVVVTE